MKTKHLIAACLTLCFCFTAMQSIAAGAKLPGVPQANDQDAKSFQQASNGTKQPGSRKPGKDKTSGITLGPNGTGW